MTAVKGSLSNDLDRIGRRNNHYNSHVPAMNLPSPPPPPSSSPHYHVNQSSSSPTTTNTMSSSNLNNNSNTRHQLPPTSSSSPSRQGTRLPMISHPHPFYDVNLFMHPSGMMMMPLPLPPPPYSTLPHHRVRDRESRENNGNSSSHQRRLIDTFLQFNSSLLRSSNAMLNRTSSNTSHRQSNSNGSQTQTSGNNSNNLPSSSPTTTASNTIVNNNESNGNPSSTSSPSNGVNNNNTSNTQSQSTCLPTTSTGSPTPPVLPSYHHLYSSSSPASMRRRRRRMLRQQRLDPASVSVSTFTSDPSGYLSENRKYLVFVSLFVIGIVLTFIGVVTLSLFTISFGFTFILFSLLLYKLLPSSKYAPRGGSNPAASSMFTLDRVPVASTTAGGRSRSPLSLSCIPGPYSSHPSHPRSLHGMMHLPPHVALHHPLHSFPHPVSHASTPFFATSPVSGETPVAFSLPPPPPSYQEALTAGHTLIQPLNASSLQESLEGNSHERSVPNSQSNGRGQHSSHGNISRNRSSNIISNNNSEVTVTTSGVTVEPTTVITVEAVTHRTDLDDEEEEDSSSPSLLSSPDLVSSCHTNVRQREVGVRLTQDQSLSPPNSSLTLMPTTRTSSSPLQGAVLSSSRGNNNNNCITICTVNDTNGDNNSCFDGYSVSRDNNNRRNRGTHLTTSQATTTMTDSGVTVGDFLETGDSSSDERNANRLHFVTIIEATI